MLHIDGAQGEGGGQIVRSSLALSIITQTPFTVSSIRAGRAKPGLKPQHVTAIGAAREVCGGNTAGVELGSNSFSFAPGPVQTRSYNFSVPGAGSATLVAQTVLPALMLADAPSSITVYGGTHNSGAPPFDFLSETYLPQVEKMGPRFTAALDCYGFVPVGGGKFTVDIEPAPTLDGLDLLEQETPLRPTVAALLSRLDQNIGEREIATITKTMRWPPALASVVHVESPGPGNVVMATMDYGNVREIITGFGKRGLNAKVVARNVCAEATAYIANDAPVGTHLADQLLLPMALAATNGKASQFVTGPLSPHATTHMNIIEMFLGVRCTAERRGRDANDESVVVTVGN